MTYLFLPRHSKTLSKIIALLIVAQLLLTTSVFGQSESFVPIPPDTKTLYRFNLEKLFYANDAARQNDINEFLLLKTQFEKLIPPATSSATNLLEALELYQKLGILQLRLNVYGELRSSINSNDTVSQGEAEKITKDFNTMEALLKI